MALSCRELLRTLLLLSVCSLSQLPVSTAFGGEELSAIFARKVRSQLGRQLIEEAGLRSVAQRSHHDPERGPTLLASFAAHKQLLSKLLDVAAPTCGLAQESCKAKNGALAAAFKPENATGTAGTDHGRTMDHVVGRNPPTELSYTTPSAISILIVLEPLPYS